MEFFEPSTLSSENLTVNDHGGCEQQPLLLGEIQYFSTWHVHHPVNNWYKFPVLSHNHHVVYRLFKYPSSFMYLHYHFPFLFWNRWPFYTRSVFFTSPWVVPTCKFHWRNSCRLKRWRSVYCCRVASNVPGVDQKKIHHGFWGQGLNWMEVDLSSICTYMCIPPALESRWRNSHVLVYHGPLLSHLLGVASHLHSPWCIRAEGMDNFCLIRMGLDILWDKWHKVSIPY